MSLYLLLWSLILFLHDTEPDMVAEGGLLVGLDLALTTGGRARIRITSSFGLEVVTSLGLGLGLGELHCFQLLLTAEIGGNSRDSVELRPQPIG